LNPDTEIKCYDKKYLLKEVNEKVCEGFYQHVSTLYPKLAEKERLCKSIRAVLSGHKLKWFTGEAQRASNPGCHGLNYFVGARGRHLKTPTDFKNASVWLLTGRRGPVV
jgi:hypothetical protein